MRSFISFLRSISIAHYVFRPSHKLVWFVGQWFVLVPALVYLAWHDAFGNGKTSAKSDHGHAANGATHVAVHGTSPWLWVGLGFAALVITLAVAEHRHKSAAGAGNAHKAASALWLAIGAVLGAVPLALHSGAPLVRAAVTVAILVACWGMAWIRAGAVAGAEAPWRGAVRSAPRWAVAVAVVGGTLVAWWASALRLPGGDVGWAIGGFALFLTGAEIARGQSSMRDRVAVATGHEALADVKSKGGVTTVTFAPSVLAATVRRHAETLREALEEEELEVEVDPPLSRRIVIRPAPPLPKFAPMPTEVTTGERELPIGVKRAIGQGETVVVGGVPCHPVLVDFNETPHAASFGTTGSGKTIEITVASTQALLRGWEIWFCEPIKGGIDLFPLRPWCRGFATSLEEAVALVADLLTEVDRRKVVLSKYGEVNFSSLPLETRRAERCLPALAIFDELYSTLALSRSKSQQSQAINSLREAIDDGIGRLMREARFVDIHVQVGLQRPDYEVFDGETKANIGVRLLCGVADRYSRSMALRDPDNSPKVGRGVKGRAVLETDSDEATEVQLYYVSPKEAAAVLTAAGIPHAKPFNAPAPVDSVHDSPPPKPPRPRARRAPRRDDRSGAVRVDTVGTVKVIVDKRSERAAPDVEAGVAIVPNGDGSYRSVGSVDPDEAA